MASQAIYQFHAELADYEPSIWRRFRVLDSTSMSRLGYIIMTMFEMQACHLYHFEVPVLDNFHTCVGGYIDNAINGKVIDLFAKRPELARLRIELPNEYGSSEYKGRTLDAKETRVKNVLTQEMESMTFFYDYSDGWEVRLVLEKIFEPKDVPGGETPCVLEGIGYGIIEDCGGPSGLENIADAFEKKEGSEYLQYCEWLGDEDLDLASFDIDDINFRLKRVPRIYEDAYEYGLEPTKHSLALLMRIYKGEVKPCRIPKSR